MKLRKFAYASFALAAVATLAACGTSKTSTSDKNTSVTPTGTKADEKVIPTVESSDEEVYSYVLGDFQKTYAAAKAEISNIDLRYVEMAEAEAKLLESATLMPLTANGGNYAISNAAVYSVPYTLWGNDDARLKTTILTTKLIKKADRDAMKAEWSAKRGTTDFDYDAWAKSYLTGKGYEFKRTYNSLYTSDPECWDVLATSKAVDSEPLVNTYDSLLEYDQEGDQQPALATGYEVSKDGLTYTFTLRDNAKWYTVDGAEIAAVKAQDFVDGFQHLLDAAGGLEWLVDGVVEGVTEYLAGEATIEDVGVKAEGNKVVYTLSQPCSYFPTMMAYNIFAPLCGQYYKMKGGQFGDDYDANATTYKYGKDYKSIAYCGPYFITAADAQSKLEFTKNENYYNKDKVNIDKITWQYTDGSDTTESYNNTLQGKTDGAGLNTGTLKLAKEATYEGVNLFDNYAYTTNTGSTTYCAFYNVKRQTFELSDGSCKSAKDQAAKDLTAKAMMNNNFRMAISQAFDRVTYNGCKRGSELAPVAIRNTYTPGSFCTLSKDVTYNGVTYAQGTAYGELVQKFLTADGSSLVVYKNGSSDGFDGWYNVEAAKASLAKAITELAAQGVTISAANPVQIDYPYYSASELYANSAQVYKKSLEEALGGVVKVNLVACEKAQTWYNCGYFTESGKEANYDMYDLSGWGPDYGDPSTYLDTMLDGGAGYMAKCIGLF